MRYKRLRQGDDLVTVPVPETWEERLLLRYPSLRDEIVRLKGLKTPPSFQIGETSAGRQVDRPR